MRFKVGDKVRIREDLKTYYNYGFFCFIQSMEKHKNKVAKITKINNICNYSYVLDIDNGEWRWTDEMLEPVEVIDYKGKQYDVYKEIDCDNDKFNKVLQLQEHKEEILDEEEKEYLNNVIKYVIKPTHNEVKSIYKEKTVDNLYYIHIHLKSLNSIRLPDFNDIRMYKGMELWKIYTLKDLGLEE